MNSYSDIFDETMKGLPDKPKTIEEARKLIEAEPEVMEGLETIACINGLAQVLINKGIMTEEEYTVWYKATREELLNNEARKLLKMFEEGE